jgi:hypothetical protein
MGSEVRYPGVLFFVLIKVLSIDLTGYDRFIGRPYIPEICPLHSPEPLMIDDLLHSVSTQPLLLVLYEPGDEVLRLP